MRSEPTKTRRDVLKILALAGGAGLAWKAGWFGGSTPQPVSRKRVLMGTTINLTVVGDDADEAARVAESTLARMAALEAELTRYRDDSAVGRLNRSGEITDAPTSLLEVLRLADHVSQAAEGAFDVTIQPLLDTYSDELSARQHLPSTADIEKARRLVDQRRVTVDGTRVTLAPGQRLTLDGIGKGYIVDAGVATLKAAGFGNVLVEAGGDLVASGRRAPDRDWTIGIVAPRPGISRVQARVDASDVAMATSGDYMQPFTPDLKQHHILDPRTGHSAPELASATVTAPTAALADALATAAMVLGPKQATALIEAQPGCAGYFVSKSLDVTQTAGFVVA